MTDINQEIYNYLRDAQWKTAELTVEMDEIKDEGNIGFQRRDAQRLQLSIFMDVLYVTDYSFYDGYNFIYAGDEPWTDKEIQAEIDYLRSIGELSEVPFLTFADFQQTTILNAPGEGGDPSTPSEPSIFPYGNQNDFLFYANSGNTPIATPFPNSAGHINNETIDNYFLNRT